MSSTSTHFHELIDEEILSNKNVKYFIITDKLRITYVTL